MINILYTVERIGPYHNARFNSVSKSKGINLNVLETNSLSKRYPWEENFNQLYKVFKLSNTNIKNLKLQTKKEVKKILDRMKKYLIIFCLFVN